jgi:hypothetical protein
VTAGCRPSSLIRTTRIGGTALVIGLGTVLMTDLARCAREPWFHRSSSRTSEGGDHGSGGDVASPATHPCAVRA